MVYLIEFVIALLESFGKRMLELDVENGGKSGAGCEVCDTSLLPHAYSHHVDCAHQLQELCPFPDCNIPPPSIPAPGHSDSTKKAVLTSIPIPTPIYPRPRHQYYQQAAHPGNQKPERGNEDQSFTQLFF